MIESFEKYNLIEKDFAINSLEVIYYFNDTQSLYQNQTKKDYK